MDVTSGMNYFGNIFSLLNRRQKRISETVKPVKDYEKKEWKFILPADREEKVSKWPELMTACSTGDAAKVNTLLQEEDDIDVNQQDDEGVTPLLLASRGGHAEIVKQLLSKGAQVDIQSKKGKTALMKACKYGHLDVVKQLLVGNVNLRSNEGVTALMYASFYPKPLDFGMFSNTKKTAPMSAASTKHVEIVKLLLDHGAKVNWHDNEGGTALMAASLTGHTEVVKLLLDHGAQVNLQGSDNGVTALMCASNGHTEIVKLLLDHGAQVNFQSNEEGFTALMWASFFGHTEIVKLLLNHGALVNLQANDKLLGFTALMCASVSGHIEVVKLLLRCGAQVRKHDNEGQTALMHASEKGHASVAKLLLDNGAELEVPNGRETPLMKACLSGSNFETVKLLLDSGANINVQDANGQSALLKACSDANDINLINLLLNSGARLDLQHGLSEVIVSIDHANSAAVLSLLEHGAKVNITDINAGYTPLTLATQLGLREIFEYLVFYGADLNLRDSGGKSALIHAVCNGHRDIATQLIEFGAQIDSQDKDGWSALMYAVKAGDLETVQCLVSYGASVRLKTSDSYTSFDICSRLAYEPFFQDLFQTLLSSANNNLEIDLNYRGIVFCKTSVTKQQLSSSASTINDLQDSGISVSVPENSLGSPEESVELCIRPCFTGPFELPDQYESASPAYLIHHGKITFQKDITIRIHHYASLQSEEDCEDMAFLTASSTPEYRGSRPVYTFKEIPGAKGVFRPGDQVGEISLSHCSFFKSAKKKHRVNQCLYSARLYRNTEQKGDVSAIFCICLFSPVYMQHCDKAIMNEYTGISGKGEGKSQVYAQIVGEVVEVNSSKLSGWTVSFDQRPTQILKRDVDVPKNMDMKISELVDYPPRLLIYVKQTECSSSVSPPEVQVIGLDRECSFGLPLSELSSSELSSQLTVTTDDEVVQHPCSLIQSPQCATCAAVGDTRQPPVTDTQSQLDDSVLGLDDLSDVLDAVETLSAQWRLLSTKLRLKPSSLDVIKQNHPGDTKMCLYEALEEWLRMNYDHQRYGRPSWRKLVETVRSLDCALSERIAVDKLVLCSVP